MIWAAARDNCFRDRHITELSTGHIWREIWKHVPNLMTVLVAAAKNVRGTNLKTEDHSAIIMCVAILMKLRSPRQLKYLQTLIGLMLFDGHATKQVSVAHACILENIKSCMFVLKTHNCH